MMMYFCFQKHVRQFSFLPTSYILYIVEDEYCMYNIED